ncbi:MAG TPA: hypothetical protein VNV85_01300 [Puia sp.]|jgi:hypothetical protein|nr:hypothetical protein [Puia sp.]
MNTIEACFEFSDDAVSATSKYYWDMSILAKVETIKCFLAALIQKHWLSGKITVKI